MILLYILVLDVKGYSHYWTKGKFLQNVPLVLFLLLSFHTKHATLKNMAFPLLKKTAPTTLSPLVYSAFHLSKITLELESVFRDLIDKFPMPSRNILRGERGITRWFGLINWVDKVNWSPLRFSKASSL